MAAKWLKQANRATQLLYDAEVLASRLFGEGLDEFLKLRPVQQRNQMARLYDSLTEGRDMVHAMVDSVYEIHCEGKKRG